MFGSSNRTIIQIQTSKTTQKWVTGHKTKLLLWPFPSSDLNPVENEWGELKRRSTNMELWIWRIWRDSVWRKWSLISYQVFSKLFRHYRRKLRAVILGKWRCNNWVPILWPTWTRESIYFTMRFSPHFQLFYFNDRLEFCDFFEKDKKDKQCRFIFTAAFAHIYQGCQY